MVQDAAESRAVFVQDKDKLRKGNKVMLKPIVMQGTSKAISNNRLINLNQRKDNCPCHASNLPLLASVTDGPS